MEIRTLDSDVVLRDDDSVDPAASAKANLKEVGNDLKKILPDKTADAVTSACSKGGGEYAGMGKALAFFSFPWMVLVDANEVVAMPLVAAKDAIDAAAHGIAAGRTATFDPRKDVRCVS